ncbi:YceI family protein [Synoicihabitans lomoniglobus]|uniref:YceI family protein n=1 Tax=Synoicihabitans lomoniglobus TaxID=2909285 RepID=A0AAF0CI08_9BACT|nr:YceI family protein [Opitutaceae bacterium LMO-M01]WED64862.1 YceI family protein [Opitutaceae bacterium LMO-M01]
MKSVLLSSLLLSASVLSAAPQAFDFQDPKGVNAARFSLDAPLEAISGSGNGISGEVRFDSAAPADFSGHLTLATASLTVPNGTMKEHLHGANWLDVTTYPEITFVTKSVRDAVTSGTVTKARVTGDLTIKGVTKTLTVPVTLTSLPGKLSDRTGGQMQGDLLVLRTTFSINRSEFGIMPGQATDKVAETIELSLALAGAAAR